MEYLVQAILTDGDIETVIDSIKTDDDKATVDFLMRRHKTNSHYRYVVMEISTQKVVINTTRNIYY